QVLDQILTSFLDEERHACPDPTNPSHLDQRRRARDSARRACWMLHRLASPAHSPAPRGGVDRGSCRPQGPRPEGAGSPIASSGLEQPGSDISQMPPPPSPSSKLPVAESESPTSHPQLVRLAEFKSELAPSYATDECGPHDTSAIKPNNTDR